MPSAATTLAFYRQKQTIASFADTRPKSLAALRHAARDALTAIQAQLGAGETEYLQGYPSHEAFAYEHLFGIKALLSLTRQRQLSCRFDFDFICEKAASSGDKASLYTDQIAELRALGMHITNCNPAFFEGSIAAVEEVIHYIETYCLSFAPNSTEAIRGGGITAGVTYHESQLESPIGYDKQRQLRIQQVKDTLHSINEKAQKFGLRGVEMSDFSVSTIRIFRRCDCSIVPAFLLFPQSCEQIREAINIIIQWLEEDREYAETLSRDIESMTKQEHANTTESREWFVRLTKVKHNVQCAQLKVNKDRKENPEVQGRLLGAEDEQQEALTEVQLSEAVVKKTSTRLRDLAEKESELPGRIYRTEVSRQRRSRDDALNQIPRHQILAERAKTKIIYLEKKVDQMWKQRQELDKLESQEKEMIRELRDCQRKGATLNQSLSYMRQIYLLKTSPSTLKKIFFGIPVVVTLKPAILADAGLSPRLAAMAQEGSSTVSRPDALGRAILMTSRVIENDWRILYFKLPFHPPRGLSDIEGDVDRVDKKYVRGSRRELALESLITWRRLHTRATLEGLKSSLMAIGRSDVVRALDARIHKPGGKSNDEPTASLRPGRDGTFLPPLSPISRLIQRHRKAREEEASAESLINSRSLMSMPRSQTFMPLTTR